MKKYLRFTIILLPLVFAFGVFQEHDFIKRLKNQLQQYQEDLPEEKVYLHTDRPFYTAGDDIWFKAYLTNAINNEFSQLSDVMYAELISPKGNVVSQLRLPVKTGIAHGDFHLDDDVPGGIYTLVGYTEWMKNEGEKTFFKKKIQVQKVILPRLLMQLDFKDKAYGANDLVEAEASIKSLEDKPLSHLSFKATANINGKQLISKSFETDREGKAIISFRLPENLDSNDGLLNLTFSHEGQTESISRSIPIVLNAITLDFFPEGGELVESVNSQVAFKAVNEFGKAADISGNILDEAGNIIQTFNSYHMGMGKFSFTPEKQKKYYAQIQSPTGIAKQYPLPKAKKKGYTLALKDNQTDALTITYFTPKQSLIHLVAQVRGKIYYSQSIEAAQGKHSLNIPTQNFPSGIAQITLFNALGEAECERLAFVNAHKKINVQLKTNKEEYAPKEKVTLNITTTDEHGKAIPTNLSLSVVDDKLLSFADDNQDNILSWLLMSSDLKGEVEEPSFYFKKDEEKASQGLDLVMMTHGWRKFEWETLLNSKPKANFSVEIDGVVSGQLIDSYTKATTTGTVYLKELTANGRMEKVKTDNDGKFSFYGVNPNVNIELLAQSASKSPLRLTIKLLKDHKSINYKGTTVVASTETVSPKMIKGEIIEEEVLNETETVSSNLLSLNSSSSTLDEIVVTGYGIENSKKSFSYAISTVNTNPLNTEVTTVDVLRGNASGVQITRADGTVGSSSSVAIRGISSLPSNNQPLFVVHGYPIQNNLTELGINPENIESIQVIKGASATTLYGSRGANGVVLITMKNSLYKRRKSKWKENKYAYRYVAQQNNFSKVRVFYAPDYSKVDKESQRVDFRKTIYWEPNVQTNKQGKAKVTFYNSDATTVFRMIAEGIGINGQITHAEETYHTIKPFSLDAKIPPYLTFEDRVEIPVTLKNKTNKDIKGELIANAPEHLQHLQPLITPITVKANSTETIHLLFSVNTIAGKGNITLAFKNKNYSDQLTKTVEVYPKGFPVELALSANDLSKSLSFQLFDPVPGSIQADFKANRDVVGKLMDGVASIFRQPHGCFEQTSSSTYPNVMALNYLRKKGVVDPQTEKKALSFIDYGYKTINRV